MVIPGFPKSSFGARFVKDITDWSNVLFGDIVTVRYDHCIESAWLVDADIVTLMRDHDIVSIIRIDNITEFINSSNDWTKIYAVVIGNLMNMNDSDRGNDTIARLIDEYLNKMNVFMI